MKKLSILIPTIKEREDKFKQLINTIKSTPNYNQADIEISYDDSPRYDLPGGISVGEKRQLLIERCNSKYFIFVDDDDTICERLFTVLLPLMDLDVDVFSYQVDALIDGVKYTIDQSIYNKNEQLTQPVTRRHPSVMACYRTELAKKNSFTKKNNAEDFEWAQSLGLKTEYKINEPLQLYIFDSKKTVASKAYNPAIVTFSNTPKYSQQVEIQKQSVQRFAPDIKHYHFSSFDEVGCKPHSQYPYAFKPYSIHKVREMGHNLILWLDSPVHFVKPATEIFNYLKQHGIILFDNIGHSLGSYTNDVCLAHFGIERKQSYDIKMVMACAMGFDFTSDSIRNAFDCYLSFAHENAYQGNWNNNNFSESKDPKCKGHRHDQSVISCIAYQRNIPLLHPNQTFIAYHGNEGMLPHAESVCLISKTLI